MPAPDPRITQAARLHQAKNYPAAEQAYRFVLGEQPNNTDVLLLLGALLHETGRHEESVDVLRRGIAVTHRPADLRRAMVGPLVALGDLESAMIQARELLRLAPGATDSHLILAQLLTRAGQFAAAEPHARRAVDLGPNAAVGWLVLARVLNATGRPFEALTAFNRALAIAPGFVEAAVERAFLLQQHGRLDEAVVGYEQVLRIAPQNLVALNNAGNSYVMLGRPETAIPLLEAAARLSPTDAKPWNNLGVALKDAGQIDRAIGQLIEAARVDPTYTAPAGNIGLCYAAAADHDRAIDMYRRAEALDPAFAEAGSNALLSMLAMDGPTPADVRAAHVDWARRHADPLAQPPPPAVDVTPDRRLRIGYLSPDLRDHSVRYFIEPVLAAHDRSAVEVCCYAAGRRRDEVTKRLAKLADQWHDVAALDAAATADLIRSHQVDVLIDLAGHTSDNRLFTLARRPAPVQATYLGYPATTGVGAIDYRLTDAVADPPDTDGDYTERLVRLPDAFFVYGDDPARPYDPALPADRNGYVTFGAFNNYSKVTPTMLAAWATIVSAVPNSRIVLKGTPMANPGTQAAVLAAFAAAGVSADRVQLRQWVTLTDHYALLGSVDLCLDTFPYSGHTTTCQALWMGAAVLTRHGAEFRSRVGLSIMARLGLPELAVHGIEPYVLRAVQLATDLSRLRELRPTWRERMRASPLCDAERFTRNLEAAYRQMWTGAVSAGRGGGEP